MPYFVRPCSLPQSPFCAPCKERPIDRWRVAVRALKSLIWRVLSVMIGSAGSGECEFSPCYSATAGNVPVTPGARAPFSPHLPHGSSRRDLGGAWAAHAVRRGLKRRDRGRSERFFGCNRSAARASVPSRFRPALLFVRILRQAARSPPDQASAARSPAAICAAPGPSSLL